MKTTFLSVVCLIILAATSYSQKAGNGISPASSPGLFQVGKPIINLHNQRVRIKHAVINGYDRVIHLEKTYQASFYAGLGKGEFDFILSDLLHPVTPVQKFINNQVVN